MGGINHQTWGALLLFYHYSHEQKYQKLTALQAGFQWPFQQGISTQTMAKNMVLTYLHVLDPGDLPLRITTVRLPWV